MSHSFSFGFESDDIDDDGHESAGDASSHDTPEHRHVADMKPTLHDLQALVWKATSSLHSRFGRRQYFFFFSCAEHTFSMALRLYNASGCTGPASTLSNLGRA